MLLTLVVPLLLGGLGKFPIYCYSRMKFVPMSLCLVAATETIWHEPSSASLRFVKPVVVLLAIMGAALGQPLRLAVRLREWSPPIRCS